MMYKLHKKALSLLSQFVVIVSVEFAKFTGKLVTHDKLATFPLLSGVSSVDNKFLS